MRRTFSVHSPDFNPAGWFEYQLVDSLTRELYRHGAKVRENRLKAGDEQGQVSYSPNNTMSVSPSKQEKKKNKRNLSQQIHPFI